MSRFASRARRLSEKDEVAKVAKCNGTSVNQFIAIAVAEKISALETEEFFPERARDADPDDSVPAGR